MIYQHDWASGIPQEAKKAYPAVIIADPPYNIGVKYADDLTGDRMEPDYYRLFLMQSFNAISQILRERGGVAFWVCPASHWGEVARISSNYDLRQLYGAPFIWYETFAQYQQAKPTMDYRLIFCLTPKDCQPYTNMDAIRVPSKRQEMGDKRANPEGRVPGMVWQLRRLQGTSADRVDWHPAQLPPELLDRMILGWSPPASTIMDMFAGSGSAGLAAIRHNRNFVGFDKSKTYVRFAIKRLQEVARESGSLV